MSLRLCHLRCFDQDVLLRSAIISMCRLFWFLVNPGSIDLVVTFLSYNPMLSRYSMKGPMDEIRNKLTKLKQLKEEEYELSRNIKQQENHDVLDKLLSNKHIDIKELYNFVSQNKLSDEDYVKVHDYFIEVLREGLKTRNIEKARVILECLFNLKADYQKISHVFNECLDDIVNTTSKLRTPVRISIIETTRKIDEENVLSLSSYIKDLEVEIMMEMTRNVDKNPKALDKLLNEIAEIGATQGHLKDHLQESYNKYEKMYLDKVIRIIKDGDQSAVLEDVIYVVHKIKKRNNIMGQSMIDYIKFIVNDQKILNTEEEYTFFEKMFY